MRVYVNVYSNLNFLRKGVSISYDFFANENALTKFSLAERAWLSRTDVIKTLRILSYPHIHGHTPHMHTHMHTYTECARM